MTASAEILFALLRAALGKGAASFEGAEARSERLDFGSVSMIRVCTKNIEIINS